jgi:hypothetical protein
MKNALCRFHHFITEIEYGYDTHEEVLVDEVCAVVDDNPKHHNEYDCKDCKLFKEKLNDEDLLF